MTKARTMRSLWPSAAALAITAGLLTACTGTPGGGNQSSSPAPGSPSTSPSATASASGTASSTSPAPDTETTVPAPPPGAPTALPSGPGQGNAELAITVLSGEGAAAVNYTLVCESGKPAAESNHPAAEAACAALKKNAALLHNSAPGKDQACTEQYGGPQKATVTGVVDGTAVDSSFARTNGCEISAWEAAKDVLGAAGGAV